MIKPKSILTLIVLLSLQLLSQLFGQNVKLSIQLGHMKSIEGIEFNNNENLLMSYDNNTIILWNISLGVEFLRFNDNEGIKKSSFSLNSDKIISSGYNNDIKIYDIKLGKIEKTLTFNELITDFCLRSDEEILIASDNLHSLNIKTGKSEQLHPLKIVRFMQENNDIYIVDVSGTIYKIKEDNSLIKQDFSVKSDISEEFIEYRKKKIEALLNEYRSINDKFYKEFFKKHNLTPSVNFLPNLQFLSLFENKFFIYGYRNKLNVLDINKNKIKFRLFTYKLTNEFTALAISAINKLLIVGTKQDRLIFYTPGKKNPIKVENSIHLNQITSINFSKSEKYFATASADRSIMIWNSSLLKPIKRLYPRVFPLTCYDLDTVKRKVIAGNDVGIVKLFNYGNLSENVISKKIHNGYITDILYYPENNKIVTSGLDNYLVISNDSTDFIQKIKFFNSFGSKFKKMKIKPFRYKEIYNKLPRNINTDFSKNTFSVYGYKFPNTKHKKKVFSLENNSLLNKTKENIIWQNFSNPIKKSFVLNNGNKIFIQEGVFKILISSGDTISIALVDNTKLIAYTSNGYYMTNKGGIDGITFRKGNKVFPPEQFDLKFNRPDIVLSHLGFASKQLLDAYHNAYLKRLKKMGFEETDFNEDLHVPETIIENFEYLPVITDSALLGLNLNFIDKKYNLDRINIWINNVAVYGSNGINLRNDSVQEYRANINLNLIPGNNKIQISCLNQKGVESLKETFEITYNPKKYEKPDLFLITIGTSEYSDQRFNLQYAAKDATDVTNLFKNNKYFREVKTKVLTNENVTIENIVALKEFLKNATINDQVILFFAGHGVLDENLDYYLASNDMDFSNPSIRGIAYEKLEEVLDGIRPLKKILFMDACHSGEIDKDEVKLVQNEVKESGEVTFRNAGSGIISNNSGLGLTITSELTKELFTDLRRGTGATVISSAGGGEFAMESGEWKNGLFSYCLLNGIQSKKADLNKDGKIMLSELQKYLNENVTKLSKGKQQPSSRIENIEMDFRVW
ncbi:MAG: caspase family protein [Bacteroidales bacterium]|nr:caspase family protein [Bacteroidales bacterium]